MIYRAILAIRHLLYDKGAKKSERSPMPSICIGNITVGGTGKTPHTEMVLRTLQRSEDWAFSNVAMLSRGYRRKTKGYQVVPMDASARAFGDEPSQIARKFPGVTVAVDKDRIEGCRNLSSFADIVVLDDAFQYRRLRADVNIVLVDYHRPIHKDSLLPFGKLRDLPSRLKDADIIIVTKCPSYLDEWERGKWASQLGMDGYGASSCKGVCRRNGKRQTLLFTTIAYCPMEPVFEDADSRYMYSSRLLMMTGIASDKLLAGYLSDTYKIVRQFSFQDHHKFTACDLRTVSAAVKQVPTACIATTEKDASRIRDVKKIPGNVRERLFQVPIEVRFLTEAEEEIFETTLSSLLKESRSGL